MGLNRGREVPRQRHRGPALKVVGRPLKLAAPSPTSRALTHLSPLDRLEDWSRSQSGYGPRSVSRFPALQVEEFVNNALLPLFVSDAEGDERKARLRALKRAIMASM